MAFFHNGHLILLELFFLLPLMTISSLLQQLNTLPSGWKLSLSLSLLERKFQDLSTIISYVTMEYLFPSLVIMVAHFRTKMFTSSMKNTISTMDILVSTIHRVMAKQKHLIRPLLRSSKRLLMTMVETNTCNWIQLFGPIEQVYVLPLVQYHTL